MLAARERPLDFEVEVLGEALDYDHVEDLVKHSAEFAVSLYQLPGRRLGICVEAFTDATRAVEAFLPVMRAADDADLTTKQQVCEFLVAHGVEDRSELSFDDLYRAADAYRRYARRAIARRRGLAS